MAKLDPFDILARQTNCKRAWANFSGCDPQFREPARVPVRELYELIIFFREP